MSHDGNIFLTNIHRVYASDYSEPSFDDEDLSEYFLGGKPVAKTNDSKIDLGDIVRDIDELVVMKLTIFGMLNQPGLSLSRTSITGSNKKAQLCHYSWM